MKVLIAAHLPEPTSVISPAKISHYGIRTTRLAVMRNWYTTVLGASVAFESDKVCLITFNSEHHRVALLHVDDAHAPFPDRSGLEHVAFSYAKLGDLVSTYERLKEADINPNACINHGTTTSIYYSDPDGNRLELLVDNFPDVEGLQAWYATGAHERHLHGAPFDADALAQMFHGGVPVPKLLKQGSTD